MKKIITASLILESLISCEKRQKDATELCGCYTQLHRAVALKKNKPHWGFLYKAPCSNYRSLKRK